MSRVSSLTEPTWGASPASTSGASPHNANTSGSQLAVGCACQRYVSEWRARQGQHG